MPGPAVPETLDTDVLVVGAGPTGLMAGLVLARRGVRALVIDPKPGPTRESRAIVIQARSMEILDQLDLAGPVLGAAQLTRGVQLHGERRREGQDGRRGGERRREREGQGGRDRQRTTEGLVNADFSAQQQGSTPFPGVRIFEQSRTESLLGAALAAQHSPVLHGHRLLSATPVPPTAASDAGPPTGAGTAASARGPAGRPGEDPDDGPGGAVRALVEGPHGTVTIRCRFLIGADGASSPVRRRLGLGFEGVTDESTFCVADLHGVEGAPQDAISARFGKERFALLFPLGPGGHARLIWLHGDARPEQEEALAGAREDLGVRYAEVAWFSAYRVHHRVASRFRAGPMFLAGDAAHVHSPVGGQGMNTGLQDAHHLANLLADVLSGRLEEAALDRYERERRPVALTLINATDRAFGFIARTGRGTAFLRRRARDVLALLAPRLLRTRFGPYAAGLLGQYRIHYHPVPAGRPLPRWARDRAVGRRLRPTRENRTALRAMDWQLHTYGTDAVRPAAIPEWIRGPLRFPADPTGQLRDDRLHLVRPDGFVAAAFPLHAGAASVADVEEALAAHAVAR